MKGTAMPDITAAADTTAVTGTATAGTTAAADTTAATGAAATPPKIPNQTILQYPIRTGAGEEITTVTLRRGKLKDLKLAQRNADGVSVDVDPWLVCILAQESLMFEDIEGLDLADWSDIQVCLTGLV
jgi:hypothetical protein